MVYTRLRVYSPPEGDPTAAAATSGKRTGSEARGKPETRSDSAPQAQPPAVPIRLADLYPLLAQAYQDNYLWLQDFEEDELLVSSDFFEIVKAFSGLQAQA